MQNPNEEIWVSSSVFPECYSVSNKGRVISVRRHGHVLKPCITQRGYCLLMLHVSGVRKPVYVHRLVASCFLGPCPDGHEVNHKDGNKRNNDSDNLEYVTSSENTLHSIKQKLWTHATGETHGSVTHPGRWKGGNRKTKISTQDVLDIREKFAGGVSRKALSDQYKISGTYVSDIVQKKRWRHI